MTFPTPRDHVRDRVHLACVAVALCDDVVNGQSIGVVVEFVPSHVARCTRELVSVQGKKFQF